MGCAADRRISERNMRFGWIAAIVGIAACGNTASHSDALSPSDDTSEVAITDADLSDAPADSSPDSTIDASADTGLDAHSDAAISVTDASVSTCRYWPRDSGYQCSTLPLGEAVTVGCVSHPPVPMGGTL